MENKGGVWVGVKIAGFFTLLAVLVALGFYFFINPQAPLSPEPNPEEEGVVVKLFYYNPALDQGPGGVQCSRQGLVAVERSLPASDVLITDTIDLLLKGEIKPEEKAEGVESEYPLSGFFLVSSNLDREGNLTLTFSDPENKTGGGACRAGILWFQIEATAKQFPEVKSVRFEPEELFQP